MAARKKKTISSEASPITATNTSADIKKGVNDSSFGGQSANSAMAPKAYRSTSRALKPSEAYQLCHAVRAAITARNRPLEQVKIRLFSRSTGKEIIGGETFQMWQRPNAGMSIANFLSYLGSWSDLCAERIIWTHTDKTGNICSHPLNPLGLYYMNPAIPQLPEDVTMWQYIWDNGKVQQIPASEITFEHDFNPSSLIRGNPPILAVIDSITASYQAKRMIRSFFANNLQIGGVMNVETDNPDLVAPFKREVESQHRGEENAFNMLWTYGTKVTFTPAQADISETPFAQLIKNVTDECMSLWQVPPLFGGQWDKTRFDSVDAQSDFFFESVFLPKVDTLQTLLQRLQDTQLRMRGEPKMQTPKLTRSFGARLERARAEGTGEVVVIIDADHIPSVAALKKHKVNYAQGLIDTFRLTPREAMEEVGLDLTLNEAADKVWYKSDQKVLEDAAATPIANPEMPVAEAVADEAPLTEAEAEQQDETKAFFRALRKLTLDKMDAGTHWTLNEIDTMAKEAKVYSDTLAIEIRKLYVTLQEPIKVKDAKQVKACFNAIKVKHLIRGA